MKTVLQINTALNKGSVGRIMQSIGEVLQENGWESYIAYARYGGSSNSHLIEIGNSASIYTHVLGTRLTDKHGLYSTKATLNLIKQITLVNPDVIHIHNLHGYYINYKLLFQYLSKVNIPIVWTLHDCWPFTGHCVYFDACQCDKWKVCCKDCPQIGTYPKAFIDRTEQNFLEKKAAFTLPSKMLFVPVSEWLNGLLKKSFLQEYPSVVIRNGINLENFVPNQRLHFNELKGKFVILGVANVWEERKGLLDFIKLAHALSDDLVLVLIGLNKKQIRKCPSNIIGVSHTESVSELASYYYRADVFLNLTYEDNYPTTNIESIACGTPVITYNTGGSPESVLPDNGFVVDKGDIRAVLRCIDKIRNGESKGKSALINYAKIHFNQTICFQEYLNLYESLIN